MANTIPRSLIDKLLQPITNRPGEVPLVGGNLLKYFTSKWQQQLQLVANAGLWEYPLLAKDGYDGVTTLSL